MIRRIAALLGKELAELRGNLSVVIPAMITGAVSIVIPFGIAIAVPYFSGERLSDSSDFRTALALYRNMPSMRGLDPEAAIQAMIFQQFLVLLILTPVTGAMSIAAYAVIGEKQARTLEPLLATPLTTFELLAAKVLGSFLPGLALVTVCFAIYVGGVAQLASPGVYSTLFEPRGLLTIFLLGPLASLAALQLAVCVSSRVNDVRSAQQIGALIILPLTGTVVLRISVYLVILNLILMAVAIRLFDRESILTRWK